VNLTVVVIGVALLIIIAVMIGLTADRNAQEVAWQRLDDQRERLAQERASRAEVRATLCASCPFRDLYGPWPDSGG